jgi:hypothetical protein
MSGVIESGNVAFGPLFTIDAPPDLDGGSHVIEVVDAAGAVLTSVRFTPLLRTDETTGPDPNGAQTFTVVVPRPAGATGLVVRSETSELLGTLTISGAVPTVQLLAPTPPSTFVGEGVVTWSITDADSSLHTTRVQYSNDNGVTWAELGAVDTRQLLVNFDDLPGGASTALRLMVSDGINSSTSTFGPFTTPKKSAVSARILSPRADLVVASRTLFLEGVGFDTDDGVLKGTALTWTSNIAGPLGTGERIAVNLDTGRHAIELVASDRDGNRAAATVTVVVAGIPPEVALTIQAINTPTTCVAATISVTAAGLSPAIVEYSLNRGADWTRVPVEALPFRFIVPGSGSFDMVARVFDAANQITADGERFSTSANCASVTPTAWLAPAGLSTQTIAVTPTVGNLAWTSYTDQPWLTVLPGSATGAGSVTLTAAPTTSVATRSATAWIAGQAVTVTQAAGAPSFAITPTLWTAPNAGGTQTITVSTSFTDAPWAASSSAEWLTVSAAGGIGSGGVTVTAAANPGGTRTATVTIAGHTVSVSQGQASPFDLRVTHVAGNLVTLRWSWSGPTTAGFVVAGGVQPGQTLATLPAGSASPIFTFTAPTGAFFVRVHAADDTAFVRPSNEVPLVVNLPVAPSPPVNLLGTVSGNRLDLAWTNTFGGGAPTAVTLQVTGAATAALPLALTERFSFTGVPPGTYTFAVVATNAGGASATSDSLTLTFPSPCTGAPLPPNRFLAYRIGRTVFVVWEPAETGPAPTDFILNVAELGLNVPTAGGRALSGTVLPGSYTLAVSATNPCGASGLTPAQTLVVP